MRTQNIFRSFIVLAFIIFGCAASQPVGETQSPPELTSTEHRAAAAGMASEGEEETSATGRNKVRLEDHIRLQEPAMEVDVGGADRGRQPEEEVEGEELAFEEEGSEEEVERDPAEVFEFLSATSEHPLIAMRTATTSGTVLLEKEEDETYSERHAYTPSGTATASEAVSLGKTYPGSGLTASGDGVVFNFDDADIHEVISTISEILQFNYIIDPRVTGKVNINTKGKISKKDLFPILETLLRINNATIIKRGDLYEIISLATTKQEPLPPHLIPRKDLPDADTFLIQIVPLNYISAEEMAKVLKPFISSQGADLIARDTILVILDFSSNVRKLMSLVELFDVSMFERLHVQLYEAKNADVEELATELDEVFQAFELPAETARAGGITFVPITRLNMIMAVSANQLLLDTAMQWVARMDTEVSEGALKIFVYYVQNGKALDIYDVLTQVFTGETPQQETAFKSKLRETKSAREKETKKPAVPKRTVKGKEAGGEMTGEVEFVVDERNNAIIVKCSARDYRVILKTIKKLDIYPKQVLIEVMIAEIRLDNELEMGVEWKYMNRASDYNYEITSSGAPGGYGKLGEEILSGLAVNVVKTDRLVADLKAYAAEDRVNILSAPHIIASDNQEATINVTEEIPITSGTVTTPTAEPLITTTIEYRDTGIILKVTPHINDKGLVSLDVSQEVSEQSEKTATGSDNPIFLKRSAVTTMVVQNGQTVIIGGLIREQWSEGRAGVPYLCKIPVLGYLFGFDRKVKNRAELMFLLTPYVITSIDEADEITKAFREKLSILTEQKQEFSTVEVQE